MKNEHPVVTYMKGALPDMRANWDRVRERGYQARLEGKARMHHRRHRGCFYRGWDEADADIKAGKINL